MFSPAFWTLSGITVLIILMVNCYAIFRALARSHAAETTLAWILAIMAFPGIGAAAYFLLADPSLRRAMRRKRMSKHAIREAVRKLGTPSSTAPSAALTQTEKAILDLAASVTEIPPTSGNSVQLLTRHETAFGQIETALKAAKRSIWAECYLIRNDETGYLFLDLLAQKAREGLEVKLLYDAFGSLGIDRKRRLAIRNAGGRVEEFLPMNPLRQRWAIHLRNHRKIILVDSEVGFTGGMNMGDEYSGRARRRGHQFFRDTHLEIRGPAVRDLEQIFAEDWSYATDEALPVSRGRDTAGPPRVVGSSIVAMVPSGPDEDFNTSGLVYFTGIVQASKRCYLCSPYFVPDGPTLRALASTALRGVDVRLMVPAKNDVKLIAPAARAYYPQLIQAGVRIFEYQPSMLHGKTISVDGSWGIVGSANVDIRSFRLNFEVGALVVDREFVAKLEERFHHDLESSVEITAEWIAGRGLWSRVVESAARLLWPIL